MKHLAVFALFTLFFVTSNAQTWADGVGQLFQQNCVKCHRQGGIAPFSLETYSDVAPMVSMIQTSINSGEMPPWSPDPDYKSFAHQRVMDPADIATIDTWINNGAPEGNPAMAPSVATFSSGTQLGTPDLSLTIPSYTITSNSDVYRNFVLPSGLSQAMFAKAIEIIPGNGNVVHHVLVFQDSTNNPISPSSAGGTGSAASKLLYSYVPGSQPYFTPSGTGLRLPANTRIILQVHYAPGSLGQTDATTVNFKTVAGPQREIFVSPVLNHQNMTNGPLFIPADETRTFNQQYTTPINTTLLYVFPHMHLIGKSIKSWANLPVTNDTVRFVNIPEWEFHWQDNFIFPNAIVLPSGSIIRSQAFYDNTENNPENPSQPPQDVSVGEGTYDEMMLIFFAYMYFQTGDQNIIVDDRIIPMGATAVCEGETVLLTAIEGVGYTYQWYLDGNAILNATSSSYIATAAGDYTVQISLGANTSVSSPVTVTMNSLPTISLIQPGTTLIPTGGTLQLNAPVNAAFTYQWYHNGTLIPGATSDTYDAFYPGEYYVTVNDGCYGFSDTITLTGVNALPELNETHFVVYPNPTSDNLTILNKSKDEGSFEIRSLMGEICMSGKLDVTASKIEVSELSRGSYYVIIRTTSGAEYRKLVSLY
ncbi:MAG: T9SS type A sorting domain-containing protein [Fluviicola sp.]